MPAPGAVKSLVRQLLRKSRLPPGTTHVLHWTPGFLCACADGNCLGFWELSTAEEYGDFAESGWVKGFRKGQPDASPGDLAATISRHLQHAVALVRDNDAVRLSRRDPWQGIPIYFVLDAPG
jgi:hypothetical protein